MEQNINYIAIGKRIRQYRLLKHLTQENISNATDLAASYISNIENGSTKVGLMSLIRIARALDVSMDQLLYDNMPVLVSNYDFFSTSRALFFCFLFTIQQQKY